MTTKHTRNDGETEVHVDGAAEIRLRARGPGFRSLRVDASLERVWIASVDAPFGQGRDAAWVDRGEAPELPSSVVMTAARAGWHRLRCTRAERPGAVQIVGKHPERTADMKPRHPNAATNRDHRRPTTANTRASAGACTVASTMTRTSSPSTTSMRPGAASLAGSGASTTTGTNPAPASTGARYRRRHLNNTLV